MGWMGFIEPLGGKRSGGGMLQLAMWLWFSGSVLFVLGSALMLWVYR
jgi:hypothetical protein